MKLIKLVRSFKNKAKNVEPNFKYTNYHNAFCAAFNLLVNKKGIEFANRVIRKF